MSLPSLPVVPTLPWSVRMDGSEYSIMTGKKKSEYYFIYYLIKLITSMELVASARSYFGGLLCVCWSPDGKYIVLGGEDDLVTVYR